MAGGEGLELQDGGPSLATKALGRSVPDRGFFTLGFFVDPADSPLELVLGEAAVHQSAALANATEFASDRIGFGWSHRW